MIALAAVLMLVSLSLLLWMIIKPAQWRAFVEKDNARLRDKGFLNEKTARWLRVLESGLLMQFALVVVFLLGLLTLLAHTGVLAKILY